MTMNRRTFLAWAGVAGAGAVAVGAKLARAAQPRPGADDTPSMLVDTTKCRGCRACEAACSEANHLPAPAMAGDEAVFAKPRTTDVGVYTVVNRASQDSRQGDARYAKHQCMHCLDPACASACLAKALEKTAAGPVVYHKERCLGCRYCMVACQFDVPKFDFASPAPYISKCSFCAERQAQGLKPACASVCPSGALTFGHRDELLDEARTRIYQHPEKYLHQVYGESEAGGTSWLYIGDVAPETLALKDGVPGKAFPELVSGALAAPPLVMTLWPPLLMGLWAITRRKKEEGAAAREDDHA